VNNNNNKLTKEQQEMIRNYRQMANNQDHQKAHLYSGCLSTIGLAAVGVAGYFVAREVIHELTNPLIKGLDVIDKTYNNFESFINGATISGAVTQLSKHSDCKSFNFDENLTNRDESVYNNDWINKA
jgi:hypothetical protein